MTKFPEPELNDELLTALDGSIKKWRRIVARLDHDHGTANCPLCELFYFREIYNDEGQAVASCNGCPVSHDNQDDGCNGSPYADWSHVARTAKQKGGESYTTFPLKNLDDLCQEVAQKELDYLLDLRTRYFGGIR